MILSILALGSVAALTIEETTYDGKPAFRMSNAAARVVVAPALGRVVEYGLTDGPNVFANIKAEVGPDGSRNVGGDYVVYATEAKTEFPADRSWNGMALKAEKLPDGIRLTSERGKALPLRLVREIRLDPYGSKVTVQNRLINEGGDPVTTAICEITQVTTPSEVVLPTITTDRQPRGYAVLQGTFDPNFAKRDGDRVRLTVHPSRSAKYGSKGGDGTLAATIGTARLTTFSAFSRTWRYPEGDSAKVVFTSPKNVGFARLEHRSAYETLDPRQIQQQTVTWTLAPLSN